MGCPLKQTSFFQKEEEEEVGEPSGREKRDAAAPEHTRERERGDLIFLTLLRLEVCGCHLSS